MIFSDEKRFCLDGPDGYNYYWWDKRTEPRVVNKRMQGGGGIMIWGAFSSFGTVELALIRGRMNSRRYQEILRNHLLPYVHQWPNIEFLFVQDNAPIHVSRSTRDWLDTQNVPLLPWPPIFCDCNPIENLWGISAELFMQMENNLIRLKPSQTLLFVLGMSFLDSALKASSNPCQIGSLK